MRLLSLSEASIQPRTSRLKLPNSDNSGKLLSSNAVWNLVRKYPDVLPLDETWSFIRPAMPEPATLDGSFSAASTPQIARVESFGSDFLTPRLASDPQNNLSEPGPSKTNTKSLIFQ